MKKKALVAIAGPFRLYQAIYFTYLYPDYEWDIIIMAYGSDNEIKEKMREISLKSERFNKVYMSNTLTQFNGVTMLLIECFKMIFNYIVGRRKEYCKELILKSIDEFDYDLICVACSYSLMEGALLNFARDTKIILMEEGFDDYLEHKPNVGFIKYIGSKVLYKMQFINLLHDNNYEPLKYCEKYVRFPELIKKNAYKEVKVLFDYTKVDKNEFDDTIIKSFGILDENYDAILYTSPLWNFDLEDEYEKMIQYICNKYEDCKILLKRHPQDVYKYEFKNVEVVEKYVEVPGELIMQQWDKKKHIFTYPSTILLGAEKCGVDFEIFNFKNAKNSLYKENVKNSILFLGIDREKVIEI